MGIVNAALDGVTALPGRMFVGLMVLLLALTAVLVDMQNDAEREAKALKEAEDACLVEALEARIEVLEQGRR